MTLAVFGVVLFAALLHASWNAIVKGARDKLLTTILVTTSAALLAAISLPALPAPNAASWPFIVASSLFQVTYFALLARTYHLADMSQTYPVMRGTAPLLVGIVSVLALGAHLSVTMWLGVGMICLGILGMAAGDRRTNRRGISLALLNAVVIAGYTIIDGIGVRRSGAPAAYTLWIFLVSGIPLAAWAIRTRGRAALSEYARRNWYFGLIGGVGTVASYGLALWAMTIAPIAVVAALRETSILFGAVISGLLLKEHIGFARFAAACTIAIGAAVLRLA
ncbi:MAG: EamA family transporter [Steroidobacteraceae bacterium]|jgi:drug/metabolite transporter (DMT)-like permease